MPMRIYRRFRAVKVGDSWQETENGKWRYVVVEEGRGKRTSDLKPPFYICPSKNGVQNWQKLDAETFSDAKNEVARREHERAATDAGLMVADAMNPNRKPLRVAVADYLEHRAHHAPKTVAAYRRDLNEFIDVTGAKFVDAGHYGVTVAVLRRYKKALLDKYAVKTFENRYTNVCSLLKAYKNEERIPTGELPDVDEEPAIPYTDEELKKLFAVMDAEQTIRYKFFLGTACRDREVTFAAWDDLDLHKGVYHVRRKPDVGFNPKKHESRDVRLPSSLVAALTKRREQHEGERWVFLSKHGHPDNHFLRKLKRVAFDAGLNCGHCKTTITVGEFKAKRQIEVTCKTNPVCENFFLHRFRKTCATRWSESGVPIRTIQHYLGHKSLEVTAKYLGITDPEQKTLDRAFGD
jgi:integrase